MLELLFYSSFCLCISLAENAILRLLYISVSKVDNAWGKHTNDILTLQKKVTMQCHRKVAFLFLQVQLRFVLYFLVLKPTYVTVQYCICTICSHAAFWNFNVCFLFFFFLIQAFKGKRQKERLHLKSTWANTHLLQMAAAKLQWP